MGRVYKRGKVYYLDYVDIVGERKRPPTKARTKEEALNQLREKELEISRQKLGLAPMPVISRETVGELCEWWLRVKCPEDSVTRERSRLGLHIIRTEFGKLPLRAVTSAAISAHLDEIRIDHKMSNPSRNRVRAMLYTVFTQAAKAGKWAGPNPVKDVAKLPEDETEHVTLRVEEVPLLLAHVPEQWVDMFAGALYWGLRKGELCGLQKTDVNFEFLDATITRSYTKNRVKGKKRATLPIPLVLLPYLKRAVASSPSKWVFPGPDGKMRTEDSNPERVLRAALKRAGLIDGYEHVCRRCKAAANKAHDAIHPRVDGKKHPACGGKRCEKRGPGHSEIHADADIRKCPACGMRMLPNPIPRDMVFHDLRHTTATLLIRAGVPLPHVQKILRHAQINTTIKFYGHLDTGDARHALETVFPLPPEESRRQAAVAGSVGPVGTRWAQIEPKSKTRGAAEMENLGSIGSLSECARRDSNPRPSDSKSKQDDSTTYDSVNNRATSLTKSRGVQSHGPTPTYPDVLQSGTRKAQGPLRVVSSATVELLSVKDVAARLKVSTATVYKLCESGALPHSRVLSSIRVSAEDLADFIARGGR